MGEWKEWQTGAVFASSGEIIRSGSVVTIHGIRAYRKWWQFWKPESWELPPQRYVAGDYMMATWPGVEIEDSPDRNPKGGDAKQGPVEDESRK